MSEELKIKIPVLVDDSDAAKANFKTSIETLAGQFKGDKAPKIEITVSKINATEAINKFKRQIEAVIGGLGEVKIKPSITAEAKNTVAKLAATAVTKNANGTTSREVANLDTEIKKYQALGQSVANVTPKYAQLKAAFQSLNTALATKDVNAISAAYRSYKNALDLTNNAMRQVKTQSAAKTSYDKDKAALQNLILEMQNYERANNRLHSNPKFSAEFNNISGRAQSALSSKNFGQVRQLSSELKTLQSDLKSAGMEGQTFGAKLSQQFSKLGVYLTAATVMMKVRQAIKATINSVIELDGVVTDLQIATGGTRKETQALLNTYSEMGKELGATTVDVGKAADAWLRQGYSVAQTNTLIKNSMMLSKLGQIDSAEATKALTSAMKGYNVSVTESATIVDKFTSVDVAAAVSAGYLATGLAETATSARLAGVDLNKVVGYIASIGEVTQDGAESVGNFMKTLFARMGNIKAGNLIDPESAESLGDVETTLSGLGITLRTSKGEFRNFGEVLDEVANNWSNYGSVQQRALAVAFSGYRVA